MLGLIWWPLLDQIDWDGALTHHIGKIHQVGLFKLNRGSDGTLNRAPTPMVEAMKQAIAGGEERVGKLENVSHPTARQTLQEQGPPIGELFAEFLGDTPVERPATRKSLTPHTNGDGNGNGKADPAPGLAAEPAVGSSRLQGEAAENGETSSGAGIE